MLGGFREEVALFIVCLLQHGDISISNVYMCESLKKVTLDVDAVIPKLALWIGDNVCNGNLDNLFV